MNCRKLDLLGQKFLLLLFIVSLPIGGASAFCGFYVGKADADLYNSASQVVIARNKNRTVLSMMNDYEGDLSEFAMVIPVPSILQKGQVNVADKAIFERIDAFTAPRLVEYFDSDPCVLRMKSRITSAADTVDMMGGVGSSKKSESLGVTVEAEYTVGEYDIVILSAKESTGLETWLKQEKYNIPDGASKALKPYINQGLKFFVAKVNLGKQKKTGLSYLRPLQVAFESEKFILPIRLGMINAKGPQELLVYVLTKQGRVETTNYRTVKLPTGGDIPVYVKKEFGEFYKAMFTEQVRKENSKAVFLEYFWNMGWCDPCASDPLSPEELKKLGVFWLGDDAGPRPPGVINWPPIGGGRVSRPGGGPVPVMVTRLHLRYDNKTFPDDLRFQETKDTQNYQARYVLRHPWKGDYNKCEASKSYKSTLPTRFNKEAETLANLTGWDINDIRKKLDFTGVDLSEPVKKPDDQWWNKLW